LRAGPRLRRRLLGPSGGRESRIFVTPALVAGGLVVIWVFIAMLAVGESSRDGISHAFLTYCFLAGEAGPLSIRTAFLLVVTALALNFLVILGGWLLEANRDGWQAYLPWRLTAGLWAACVLALVVILGASVLRMPGPDRLVARADWAFTGGDGAHLWLALTRRVPGAERMCRGHLRDRDFGARFEAAAILRVARGRDAELDRVMRDAVMELAAEVDAGARAPELTGPLSRMAASFALLSAELPTVITTEGRQLVREAMTPDAAFFHWWRIQDRLLFP